MILQMSLEQEIDVIIMCVVKLLKFFVANKADQSTENLIIVILIGDPSD